MPTDHSEITVLGAGMVGVSTALHLQRLGLDVTLIDRRPPGRETSFGNAGVISAGSMVPLNNPDLHRELAGLLRNARAELRYDVAHVLRHLPWFLGFLQGSKTTAARRASLALHALVSRAPDEHRALMQRCGNGHRFAQMGWLKTYRNTDPARALAGFTGALLRECGVLVRTLDAAALAEREPALRPIFRGAVHLVDGGVVDDPGALTAEYAHMFVRDGGTLVEREVRAVREDEAGIRVTGPDGSWHVPRLVMAAGPWSAELLATADYEVPLGVERGYHAHFHLADGVRLSHSVHDVDAGYVMGPMAAGLRVTTGVELAPRDSPSNLSQLEAVTPRVAEAVRIAGRTSDPVWRGARPTLPDSLPAVGALPGSRRLWANFGHQHIGFMTGPVTGRLCAELVAGEVPGIDMSPFDPGRCVRRRRPAHGGRWRGRRLSAAPRP